MPSRRSILLGLAAAATLPRAVSAEDPGPVEVVTAIYRRASAGDGTGGGQFVWLRAQDRRANLSRRTAELWDAAERATPAGDQGPPGFDPVTNAQDPQLTSFRVSAEEIGEERARVSVRLGGRSGPEGLLRFDLVRETGRWRIDDIRGQAGGEGWAIRDLLRRHLADNAPAPKTPAPKTPAEKTPVPTPVSPSGPGRPADFFGSGERRPSR